MTMLRRILAVAVTVTAVIVSAANPAHAGPIRAPLGGGSGIILSSGGICSLTTIGHDRHGKLVGFTAAHCGGLGTLVAGERVQERRDDRVLAVGVIVTRNESLDYAVIDFVPNRVLPLRSVGGTTIDGIAPFPGPGGTVCDNGRTTGRGCGVVWGRYQHYWANQACAGHGDSGGPVTVGNRLVGMVNAGLNTDNGSAGMPECTDPSNPMHAVQLATSMDDILADLNAHPNATGAGFRPF